MSWLLIMDRIKRLMTMLRHGYAFCITGLCEGNSLASGRFPLQRGQLWSALVFSLLLAEQAVEQMANLPLIWNAMTLVCRHYNVTYNYPWKLHQSWGSIIEIWYELIVQGECYFCINMLCGWSVSHLIDIRIPMKLLMWPGHLQLVCSQHNLLRLFFLEKEYQPL